VCAQANGREWHALKTEFFRDARRAFGQTALCLSGGASLGNYHWGVIKALLDTAMLPQVISGTSAGAVVSVSLPAIWPPECTYLSNLAL
jgi:predicted acylesterase/phospholipase RssA